MFCAIPNVEVCSTRLGGRLPRHRELLDRIEERALQWAALATKE
jgi:hypothetical protein